MGKKKNIVAEGNTLRIQGETFELKKGQEMVRELVAHGAHITDGRDAELVVNTDEEVRRYAAERGYELTADDEKFLATVDLSFEPRKHIDLSKSVMKIDDPDNDAFLDMLDVFANGSRAEREKLAALIAKSTYSYAQLAKVAVNVVERLGRVSGAELVYMLSENAPELIRAMLKEKEARAS